MKKWWTRLGCLLLALVLTVAALPVYAEETATIAEDDSQKDVVEDYVILLDCSMSGSWTDEENLSQQAYLNFLDKMPLTGARLTIIAFGYMDATYYDGYAHFKMDSQDDKELIHVLANQVELNSAAVRDQYKEAIVQVMEANRYNKQTWTPYAHALAAAVDLLEQGAEKNAKRNACVILISDGLLDDRKDGENDNGLNKISAESLRLLEESSKAAGERDWPIYSIHLNYGNKTAENVMQEAAELLESASKHGGRNNVGRVSVGDADDVFLGLQEIIADFQNIPLITYDLDLPGSVEFDVKPLTSEASIDIFGEGITQIRLQRQDENGEWVDHGDPVKGSVESDRLVVAKGESYYSIKLIVPPEGKWRAYVEGSGGANVKVTITSLREMNLTMVKGYAIQEDPNTKNNTLKLDANFNYRGINVDNNEAYNNMPAILKVFHYTEAGIKAIMTIQPSDPEYSTYCSTDKYGYHFQLPLNLFPNEDAILFRIVVENADFRDGVKNSNMDSCSFTDLAPECINGEPTAVTRHVGESLELDMKEYFSNPDGDPMTYTVTPADALEVSQNGDKLTIQAGLVPGEYTLTLGIQGESAAYDQLTVTVVNDPPRLIGDELPEVELWSDHYGFQDTTDHLGCSLDLNDWFGDFENMPISYTVTPSEEGIVSWNLSGSMLTLEPQDGATGEITFTIMANDGITDSLEPSVMEVTVISGVGAFWRDNWIYFAIALAILLVIIVVILLLVKNKRVKGEWEIILDDNGNQASIPNMNIANYTVVGKKGKFLLKDLVNELIPFMDETGSLAMVVPTYFTTNGAESIELVGVFGTRGCTVNKIPKNDFVTVVRDGAQATKNKITVSSGTLTVRIADATGTGALLTFSMRLL